MSFKQFSKGHFLKKGKQHDWHYRKLWDKYSCTRTAGDKWEVGNEGKRQEDSVRLFVNKAAWEMAV